MEGHWRMSVMGAAFRTRGFLVLGSSQVYGNTEVRRGYVQVFPHFCLIVTSKDKQSCFPEITAAVILKL